MIGSIIGQLVGAAVATKKQVIGVTLTRIVLILVGALCLLGAISFALVAIYHALTPLHFTPVGAAGIIAGGLLFLAAILVAIGIWRKPKPPPIERPDLQSAELSAIQALGMLNKALTDIGKNRGGASPYLGLLGIAALVGFVSGRKR